jgi:hypothetical protein
MLPGPDKVIVCPSCKGQETYLTLWSFTEIRPYTWTDGFRISAQRPRPPEIVKCGQCSYVYWLKDAEVIGELHLGGGATSPPEWHKAEHVVEPSEADYYAALASGLGRTPEEERSARALGWWKSNEPLRGDILTQVYEYWNIFRQDEVHRIRHEIGAWNPDPPARQANMELLLALLDMSDAGDRLMRAELLRQLGRFDQALAALRNVGVEEASWIVDQIRPLCEEEDQLVRLLDQSCRPDPFVALDAGRAEAVLRFWRERHKR